MSRARFEGKTALVTGAASGMGRVVAERLSQEGPRVALVDLNDSIEGVAEGLPGAIGLVADVSDSASVDVAFAEAARRLGAIEVVVHAAGISDTALREKRNTRLANGEPLNVTMEMTDDQWRRIMSVNLDGTFFVVRAALRAMVPGRRGSIVNFASLAGVEGVPGTTHYAASKAGVLGITRSVAKEVAKQGIRVNAVAPGPIATPMLSSNAFRSPESCVMGRWGKPEEVASAVLFLASEDSSYVTGETLIIAGGQLTI